MLVTPIVIIPGQSAGATKEVATTTTSTTSTTVPVAPAPLVAPEIMAKWNKVAWCEQHGNWHFNGATFDGGLGIARYNWDKFRPDDFPLAAHLATPEQQVVVAQRIQAYGGYEGYVPDQDGSCRGW